MQWAMTPAITRVPTPGEGNGVDAFFARCGLHPDARLDCLATVSRLFPKNDNATNKFEEVNPQGYCSYTLCDAEVGQVIQFRPSAHKVDPRVSEAARGVYGHLAPRIEVLETLDVPLSPFASKTAISREVDAETTPADEGVALDDDHHHGYTGTSFQVLSMSMTPGISLSELRAAQAVQGKLTFTASYQAQSQQRESLVVQFAHFIALGWKHRGPSSDAQVRHGLVCGRVGSSMRWRLEQMRVHLPPRFRPEVQRILDDLETIRALPWILTHGDIVPANVMVKSHHDEWTITGFLDWAEAEYLPFGVGLYGLEELLGETDRSGYFQYYTGALKLRELFWSRLAIELKKDDDCRIPRKVLESAHILGILLWHGIAFDDGRLDRVVDECRDKEEIQRLDAFFSSVAGQTLEESDREVVGDRILGEDVRSICMAMS